MILTTSKMLAFLATNLATVLADSGSTGTGNRRTPSYQTPSDDFTRFFRIISFFSDNTVNSYIVMIVM